MNTDFLTTNDIRWNINKKILRPLGMHLITITANTFRDHVYELEFIGVSVKINDIYNPLKLNLDDYLLTQLLNHEGSLY